MAGNYSALKQTIDSNIKQNGAQQITGPVLNSVLNQIVSSIGENATFAGIATPDTDPGSPDQNVFYIATVPGTYANFNSLTINELSILYIQDGQWKLKSLGVANNNMLADDSVLLTLGGVNLDGTPAAYENDRPRLRTGFLKIIDGEQPTLFVDNNNIYYRITSYDNDFRYTEHTDWNTGLQNINKDAKYVVISFKAGTSDEGASISSSDFNFFVSGVVNQRFNGIYGNNLMRSIVNGLYDRDVLIPGTFDLEHNDVLGQKNLRVRTPWHRYFTGVALTMNKGTVFTVRIRKNDGTVVAQQNTISEDNFVHYINYSASYKEWAVLIQYTNNAPIKDIKDIGFKILFGTMDYAKQHTRGHISEQQLDENYLTQGALSRIGGGRFEDLTTGDYNNNVVYTDYFTIDGGIELNVPNGYYTQYYIYDKDYNFIRSSVVLSGKVIVNASGKEKYVAFNLLNADRSEDSHLKLEQAISAGFTIQNLDIIMNAAEYDAVSIPFIQGSLNANGQINGADTEVYYTNSIASSFISVPREGLTIECSPSFSFRIYEYDGLYNFIARDNIPYNYKFYGGSASYIRITMNSNPYGAIANNWSLYDRPILPINPEDVRKSGLKLYRGSYGGKSMFEKFKMLPLSRVSLDNGQQDIGLTEKINLFENIINSIPNHEVEIEDIGKDQSGQYDMKGYVISPKSYTMTIAFTCHVHGNEKRNPMGLLALFKMFAEDNVPEQVAWMRDNIRWIGVFIINPWGYVNNQRLNSRNVNLNRNCDYGWAENTTDDVAHKGASVESEAETKNVTNFFKKYKGNIDFHCDWHDAWDNNAYCPAANRHNLYYPIFNEARRWLEEMNNVPINTTLQPYVNAAGAFTNLFSDTWGIPSITSEQSVYYWSERGFSEIQGITKACEMTMALHLAWMNYYKDYKNYSFFEKDMCPAYRSEMLALNTWNDEQLIAKADELAWTKTTETSGVITYNSNRGSKFTILIVGGYDSDERNISKLSVLRAAQTIKEAIDDNKWFFLKYIYFSGKVIIAPNCKNTDNINSLVSKYSPTVTIYVNGNVDDTLDSVLVKSNNADNINNWTKANYKTNVDSGISYLIGKSLELILPERLPESDRYGFCVVEWLKAILNIAISYSM